MLGRFLQTDPAGYQAGPHLYAYAGNDPLNLIDPFGLNAEASGNTPYDPFTDVDIMGNPATFRYPGSQTGAVIAGAIVGGAALVIASELPGAIGGLGYLIRRGVAENASGLGDLTVGEVGQIQDVVNAAGRPLDVVGSAARGARTATSDIDYTTANANFGNFEGLEGRLPRIDAEHGLLRGYADPNIGPSIRFEPSTNPYFVPGGPR